MHPKRFKLILFMLGGPGQALSDADAAVIFHCSERTIRNWKSSETPIPGLVAEKAEKLLKIATRGEDWRAVEREERQKALAPAG